MSAPPCTVGGAIPDGELREAIDYSYESYETVVAKLPRKDRPPTGRR